MNGFREILSQSRLALFIDKKNEFNRHSACARVPQSRELCACIRLKCVKFVAVTLSENIVLDSSFLRSEANVEQQSDANSVRRVGFRTTSTLSNHNKRLRFKRNQRLHIQLRPRDIPLRSPRPQQRVVVWRSRVSNEWVFLLRTESGATPGEIQNLTMRRIHNEKRTRSGTNRARVRRGGIFR